MSRRVKGKTGKSSFKKDARRSRSKSPRRQKSKSKERSKSRTKSPRRSRSKDKETVSTTRRAITKGTESEEEEDGEPPKLVANYIPTPKRPRITRRIWVSMGSE